MCFSSLLLSNVHSQLLSRVGGEVDAVVGWHRVCACVCARVCVPTPKLLSALVLFAPKLVGPTIV